jgi:hypothetical protein
MVNEIYRIFRLAGFTFFIILSLVSASQSQLDPTLAGEKRTLELIDQLKDLIQKAEREKRSDPLLIRQLRDVVRRYDWPWRVSLLHDDFRDGDYAYNPSWIVRSGDFWVARGSGLRTAYDAARQGRRPADRKGEYSALDILEGIFAGTRERDGRGDPQPISSSAAEIHTQLRISNAFAVKLQLNFTGDRYSNNRLEFGPYLSDERDGGYRLAYESGNRPSLTLLRVAPRRSAIIETYDQGVALEDGKPHSIEWRRGSDGEMVILLDDKEIIRAADRGYSESFDGFTVLNKGGDYELKQISIFGAQR